MCAVSGVFQNSAVPHFSGKIHVLVGDGAATRHALPESALFGYAVVQEGGLVGLRHGEARPQDDGLGEGVAAGHALQCDMASTLDAAMPKAADMATGLMLQC